MDGPQSDVDLADVNGDGFQDLGTMDANKNMLNVVLNTGHGTLGETRDVRRWSISGGA